ncbi:hypothetical protein LAZ67_17001623, partial [Cordylochernes scorpioides]
MVWDAIAYDSRSPLLRIQGTMTAQRYVDDVLRPVTLPYLQGVPNALYQQDNARPHTARISQQALQDVQMLPWPPYSPDLSPIEHVWDIIGRRLHALPQPRSEDELWQMVEREWRAIPQDAIRSLIDSLPRRVAACIAVRVSVYGEECMSIQMVRRWRSWFLEGRQNVHDDERSGRPVTATDNAAAAAVRNVVEADRRVTIDEIMIRLPPGIEIGRSSIGTIMSDILTFRKVCARWVPRLLLENHKQQRMEAARAFLEMHQRDGDQLFSRIVTGDESWVHHSTPETKRQSMVWKKPEKSAPKKAKVPHELSERQQERRLVTCEGLLARHEKKSFLHRIVTSDEKSIHFSNPMRQKSWGLLGQFPKRKPRPNRLGKKAMLCVWWDQTGVVYFELLKPGETVNTSRYEQQMHSLREALNEKRPELREKHNKLIPQHDNAPAHNATVVKNTIKDLGWELLPHPPYSPDLAPSDYHLFTSLGHALKNQEFSNSDILRKWLVD